MNCNQVQELLSMYIDNELPAKEHLIVSEHLKECLQCQKEYEELKTVLHLFNSLEEIEPPNDLKQNIMENIKQEFPMNTRTSKFNRLKNNWITWGVVAVLLITVGVVTVANDFIGYTDKYKESSVAENSKSEVQPFMARNFDAGFQENISINDESQMENEIKTAKFSDNSEINVHVLSINVNDLDVSIDYIVNLFSNNLVLNKDNEKATILAWTETNQKKQETEILDKITKIGLLDYEKMQTKNYVQELSELQQNITSLDINNLLFYEISLVEED